MKQEGKAHENKKKPPTSRFRVFVKRPELVAQSWNQHAEPSRQRSWQSSAENTSLQAATLASLGEQQSVLASNLSEIRAAEARIQSRLDALVELRQSQEGAGVQRSSSGEAHGLIGVLANYRTDADSADRLELALGEHAQTLVFDSRQAAQQASLRLAGPGRVKIASLEPQENNPSSIQRLPLECAERDSNQRTWAWMTTRILQSTYTAVDLRGQTVSRMHRGARFLLDNGTVLENDGRIVVGREMAPEQLSAGPKNADCKRSLTGSWFGNFG